MPTPSSFRRPQSCGAFLLTAWLLGGAVWAQSDPEASPEEGEGSEAAEAQPSLQEAVEALDSKYREWLQSVAGLITRQELEYFAGVGQDFRRDRFMETFWQPRDPDPATPANELRERWQEYLRSAGALPFGDPRFVLYLLNGPPGGWSLPDGRPVARCFSRTRELEIWFYGNSPRSTRRFLVIFLRRSASSPYETYLPGGVLRAVQRSGGLPTTDIRSLCADDLLRYALGEISRMGHYEGILDEVLTPPTPSPEWLATLAAGDTDLPEGAETFTVEAKISFPLRRQSRTGVQVMLQVPRQEAPGRRFDSGDLYHNFVLVGEIIRDDRLFESFRYRFEGPMAPEAEATPLGFTRYLRPGPATLRLLLEDVYTGRFAQAVQEVVVPRPDGLPSAPERVVRPELPAGPSLRLIPPRGSLLTGMLRIEAQARGEFERVAFFLDDQQLLSKRRPPYSVELNLGKTPTPHRVRVVGFQDGREVATDQVWLNQGSKRFRVRLVEPRSGAIYPGSLTARIQVETPDGKSPERLELFVNDELAATLQEAPFTQVLRLPDAEPAVIRAVGYLADGSSSEDAVLVNGGPFTQSVEVQLVELSVLVTGRDGTPISGLGEGDFRVFEDGVAQEIVRFQPVTETPLRVALLLDRSASMAPHLAPVREAALTLARSTVGSSDDRIALLSFAQEARLNTPFTSEVSLVDRGLAGLVAHGRTALYDSLVQAIQAVEAPGGQTALLLFSDGQDETSRLTFEQALDAARGAAVTLYVVATEASFADREARRLLTRLATETGGEAIFLPDLSRLGKVYEDILGQLRSRYQLAYQSSSQRPASQPRTIRVEVERRDGKVLTRQSYLP